MLPFFEGKVWDKENEVMGFYPNEDYKVELRDFRGYINVYDLSYILKNNQKYLILPWTGKYDIYDNKIHYQDCYIHHDHKYPKPVGIINFDEGESGFVPLIGAMGETHQWFEVLGNFHDTNSEEVSKVKVYEW